MPYLLFSSGVIKYMNEEKVIKYMDTWETRDGRKMKISEMDDNHLKNAMNFIIKRSEEGVMDGVAGLGYDGDYGDCWTIYGEEVLQKYGYYALKRETDRRGLSTQPQDN